MPSLDALFVPRHPKFPSLFTTVGSMFICLAKSSFVAFAL